MSRKKWNTKFFTLIFTLTLAQSSLLPRHGYADEDDHYKLRNIDGFETVVLVAFCGSGLALGIAGSLLTRSSSAYSTFGLAAGALMFCNIAFAATAHAEDLDQIRQTQEFHKFSERVGEEKAERFLEAAKRQHRVTFSKVKVDVNPLYYLIDDEGVKQLEPESKE